jgi:hypothetical protein
MQDLLVLHHKQGHDRVHIMDTNLREHLGELLIDFLVVAQ